MAECVASRHSTQIYPFDWFQDKRQDSWRVGGVARKYSPIQLVVAPKAVKFGIKWRDSLNKVRRDGRACRALARKPYLISGDGVWRRPISTSCGWARVGISQHAEPNPNAPQVWCKQLNLLRN